MEISVKTIDSNFPIEEILPFCDHAIHDKLPGSQNILSENWQQKTNSLLYQIYIDQRFDSGKRAKYRMLEADGQLIAGSGYAPWALHPSVCLLSVRTYTIPSARHRMWHAEFILPQSLSEMNSLEYKVGLLTFNKYNLWLKKFIERTKTGKSGVIGYSLAPASVYREFKSLAHPVLINNTQQWIMYQCFDPQWENEFLTIMKSVETEEGTEGTE